jgi:CheY-like chemotaxis protein
MNGSRCCLLIESDPEDQEFFIDMLHSVSATTGCYAVSNGDEALYALTTEGLSPDYIFTELNIPAMHGFDFLKRLRSLDRFKSIPVIIYTSEFTDEHIKKAKAFDVTAIYSKTRIQALRAILSKYFSTIPNQQSIL